jgi:hypothetical protein
MRERPPPFAPLPSRRVPRCQRLRRLERPPESWGRGQEHRQAVPVGQPAWPAGRGLGVPALGPARQGLCRVRAGGGPRERPPVGRHGPPRAPEPIPAAVAHLRHPPERPRGARPSRLQGRWPPGEPIDAGQQTILDSALLQRGKNRESAVRARALAAPSPQAGRLPVHGEAERAGDGLGLYGALLPRGHAQGRTGAARRHRGARP